MANNYPDKITIAPVGISRYRDVETPLTLSITRTQDGGNIDVMDNFPEGLSADTLVGAVLLEDGHRRIILAAKEDDNVVSFSYHNGTNIVTLLYSKVYDRVFASAEELAAYDDLAVLTVDTEIDADEDFWGKVVADLQDDIEIEGDEISGTLLYIDDYSAAGFVGDESFGNFLAIHCSVPEVTGATIRVKINNWSTLDADGLVVCRIADKDAQTLTVEASKVGCKTVTKIFNLSKLVCLGPEDSLEE